MMNANNISTEIHFAPLQGYTDCVYRKMHHELFGGVDYYYTPYLAIDKGSIKIKDIIRINNNMQQVTIPQLLPSNVKELAELVKLILPYQFATLNINLGCPYPMVTRKGRGAALIRKPEIVRDFIKYITENTPFRLSLKVRSGMEQATELFHLFDSIPIDKIDDVIVHPRTANQMYKGFASVEVFKRCAEKYPFNRLIYNGDIRTFSDYQEKQHILPKQKYWMIGRGLLSNPFLAEQIINNTSDYPINADKLMNQFIIKLIGALEMDSKDKGHALNRAKTQLTLLFIENKKYHKVLRKIKKVKDLVALKAIVADFVHE